MVAFGWSDRQLLNLLEVCAEFGLDEQWLRAEVDAGDFPAAVTADREQCWEARAVWTWMAEHHPDAAARAPLGLWAPCAEPEYVGLQEVRGAAVQDWRIFGVPLRVVWPLAPHVPHADCAAAAALWPPVPQVWLVGGGLGVTGPELHEYDEQGIRLGAADPRWTDLAAVLGGRAPFWPFALRSVEVMRQWVPGAEQLVVPAVPYLDVVPMLRLAAALPDGSAAARVLMAVVRKGQLAETKSAQAELELDGREQWIDVAAVPMPVPEPEKLDEATRRAGWLEILSRDDTLAHAVVEEYRAWDGGDALPFSKFCDITPASVLGREWAARLRPLARRTAAFAVVAVDGQQAVEYLVDPETDAPVARLASGVLRAAVPQRIPSASPLTEVVLEEPVWIRVETGELFMAPRGPQYGLAWGYHGTGPRILAQLLHRLLTDTTTSGMFHFDEVPAGILALIQGASEGARFSRADLEAARDGNSPA
ncbi:hypothetical protein [Nocardia wallacei]|uniref:hypothetical protein n=1 Tax=Nocardia wallacei TaxID=480035 RepID=UPI002458728A|nr:hypothetical protein [Nocardia wallacei]